MLGRTLGSPTGHLTTEGSLLHATAKTIRTMRTEIDELILLETATKPNRICMSGLGGDGGVCHDSDGVVDGGLLDARPRRTSQCG